jgi:hypothetical protein
MSSQIITPVSKKRQKSVDYKITKRRAMQGSLMFANVDTNVDPNANLMNKAHSRVFLINSEDYAQLQREHNFAAGEAVAYYEAVTQTPFHKPGSLSFTNEKHPPPLKGEGVRIDFQSIQWYINAWTGNSWSRNARFSDGGPPCFWTKDSTTTTERHTLEWREYEKKFPGRGWRVPYDQFPRYEDVLSSLKRFLFRYPRGSHVWIQGRLEGMNPEETLNRLRVDISALAVAGATFKGSINMSFDGYWNTRLEYSNDLAFYYAGRTPQRIPVIPWRVSNHGVRIFNGSLKPQLFPSSTWATKLKVPITITSEEVYSNYSGYVEMVALEETDELDFAWRKIAEHRYVMANPTELLTFVDGDTLVEWPTTPRFWEVKEYSPFNSRNDMISKHHTTFKNYMMAHPRAVILFNGGVDFANAYTTDIIAVIQVPFHHLRRNMESRVGEGNESQPTDPQASDDAQRAYARILPTLRDFSAIREPGLYMAASGAGKSTHVKSMGAATPELLKVNNPKFFMGVGSVSTSQHGLFGVGRDVNSLYEQAKRKAESGHDTSGHMIAAALCPKSHLLWYLEEVFINMTEKRSIYLVPFKEPKGTTYHSIDEYVNAINDMRKLLKSRAYPGYAREHVDICASLVDKLN